MAPRCTLLTTATLRISLFNIPVPLLNKTHITRHRYTQRHLSNNSSSNFSLQRLTENLTSALNI